VATQPAARRPLRQSIRLFRQAGELEGLLDSLHALGFAEASLGSVARAVPLFMEADDIARILGFIDRRFTTMQALADRHFTMGDLERAHNEVRAAIQLVEHVGNDEMTDGWTLLADIELERGQISAAERAALLAAEQWPQLSTTSRLLVPSPMARSSKSTFAAQALERQDAKPGRLRGADALLAARMPTAGSSSTVRSGPAGRW
jgi:tetratricopeptide (TPR) repeat protein